MKITPQAEKRLLRMALNEAIDSVKTNESSLLPPRKCDDSPEQKKIRARWRERARQWRWLRNRLGGDRRGEGPSHHDLDLESVGG